MRRLWLLFALLALASPAAAQTSTIRATDPSTGATVESVGDATFNGLRMVPAGNAWLVSGLVTETTFDTKVGSLTETAPATDTASSGLNGRLQRIAQRTSTIITTLGSPFQAGGSIGNTQFGATQVGNWSSRLQDGSGNALTSAARGPERALSVQIVDGSGNQVTSFGGGGGAGGTTQDTDDASIANGQTMDLVAALSMVYDGSFWRRLTFGAAGSASPQVLTIQGVASMTPVQIADNGGSITVDGPLTDAQLRASAVPVDGSAVTQPVSAASLPLPSGAATAANQATGNTSLDNIDGKLATAKTADLDTGGGTDAVQIQGIALPGNGGAVVGGTSSNPIRTDPTGSTTQPVSAASLPLPSGASTAANQTTANASLDSIDDKLPALVSGRVPVDGSGVTQPVSGTVTSNAGTGTFNNQQSNTTGDTDTGAGTQTTTLFGIALPASGGAVAGGTSTNPIRTDPTGSTTQPVSAASLPLPSGASTAANQSTANTSLSAIDSKLGTIDDPVATIGGVPLMRVAVFDDAGVQITSFAGGGGGGGTEYTEDAAAAANPVGGAMILVRDDALSGQTSADGDNVAARGTDKGEMYVKHVDPVAVTGPVTDAELRASPIEVDGSGVTQPVSAASLPLPSGASTSAAQTTGNNSLSSIDGKLATAKTADLDTGGGTDTVQIHGIALPGNGGAVVGGTSSNPVRTDPTGSTTQPVSAASLPLPSGAATETTLGSRLSESDFDTKIGSLTESAPGSDTASSGLNGRLQRIAQRMTSMLAVLPSSLTGSGNLKVAVQEALPAGTNNIGDVDVASLPALPAGNNNVGDVDVASLPSIPAGTNQIGTVGFKPTYAAKTTITWTGTSLGNGNARESTVIDLTSTRCADVRIRIQSKGQASGTGYINWYVYTALGDTTYTGLATGSDAAYTAANAAFGLRFLGAQLMNAATTATQTEFQLSDIYGSVPDKFGLVGVNNTGASLSSTAGDHVLEYQCVN